MRSPGADPREGGMNKGERLHYEAMQYLLYLNAGWKDKYPGLHVQDRGNLSVPEASTG